MTPSSLIAEPWFHSQIRERALQSTLNYTPSRSSTMIRYKILTRFKRELLEKSEIRIV
jgi:hypothetical protein